MSEQHEEQEFSLEYRVLIAYAVATYATTLTSMEALDRAGLETPFTVRGQVRRSLINYAAQWAYMNGQPVWTDDLLDEAVESCRAFCTKHGDRVDELASR